MTGFANMWTLWVNLLWASPPTGVEPAAAPNDIQAQYVAHRTATGKSPHTLACRVLWEDSARLCFRVVEQERRRWVTTADLAAWTVDLSHLEAGVKAEAFVTAELERAQVADMPGSEFVQLRDAHGRAVLGVLSPEALVREVGEPMVVAMPTTGVLLAWRAGNADLDKVMAVAVREMFETAKDPVTPVVHRYQEDSWVAFLEAKKP